jgi:hypothetical protein
MKRTLIFIGIGFIVIIFSFFLVGRIWCGYGIKERINIAKKQYSGIAEDALIAYLLDTTNSPQNRSNVAIWTLGQIRSKKALPILHELYKNDPEGNTCFGRHKTVLCQYEIHKAINNIEKNWWLSPPKEKNWFGLHPRLNK